MVGYPGCCHIIQAPREWTTAGEAFYTSGKALTTSLTYYPIAIIKGVSVRAKAGGHWGLKQGEMEGAPG